MKQVQLTVLCVIDPDPDIDTAIVKYINSSALISPEVFQEEEV